jgi:uncharacterized protein YgiM (DUF1202 family)
LKGKLWALSQNLSSTVCGLGVDTNERNPAQADIGDFEPDLAALAGSTSAATAPRVTVIARDGLTLRGGPGTGFARIRTLPHGTSVFVLQTQGDWAMVDLQGDGAADGFCFAAYLASAA